MLVFTFKEGVLSALAHDLKLKVTRGELELGDAEVKATFDASSLKVVCARKDGVDHRSGLSASQHSEIERNILKDVLEPARHPQIRFVSTSVSPTEVVGELSLHGVTRVVRCTRRDEPGHHLIEARLDQRDFKLKPFSAMLGTLKIQPVVQIQVRAPKA